MIYCHYDKRLFSIIAYDTLKSEITSNILPYGYLFWKILLYHNDSHVVDMFDVIKSMMQFLQCNEKGIAN